MSLLSLASAGCRQLVSVVDGVASLFALVLRLNNALAARLLAVLSVAADSLLLLLDRLTAAGWILLADLGAFVADIGDAVSAVVDLTVYVISETLLAVGRTFTAVGDGVGAVVAAVLGLVRTVATAVAAAWAAVTGLVDTWIRSVVLLYRSVIYLLTMVPYGLVMCVVNFFLLMESLLAAILGGCLSVCAGAADTVKRAALGVVDGARSVPPAALLGAGLLLLAALAARRLAQLVSARGPTLLQLQASAVRLLSLCRRASTRAGTRVWGGARPMVDKLLEAVDRCVVAASNGMRGAAAVGRLSVAVMLASTELVTRALHTFVQNVTLGLRLGAAGARRPPPLPRPPPPQQLEQPEPQPQEPADWELERVTPPPPAAPRRRLREKTTAGCASPSRREAGDASRVCVVCLDLDKSVILLPCRHVCVCEPCGRTVGNGDRRCPMCREFIQDALRVYI